MMKRRLVAVLVVVSWMTSSSPAIAGQAANAMARPRRLTTRHRNHVEKLPQSVPLMFIANTGQFNERARFLVYGESHGLWLSDDALWITMEEPTPPPGATAALPTGEEVPTEVSGSRSRRGVALRLSFPGANPDPRVEPFTRLDTHISYFIGNDPNQWHPDVPVWGGVRYVDLYPGIDLELTGANGEYQQHLVVRDESFPLNAVRLRVEGADSLAIDERGRLKIDTAVGAITLDLPQVIAADSASPKDLSGLGTARVVGNEVLSPFAQTLNIIDSVVDGYSLPANEISLNFSTFVGGNSGDYGQSAAIDHSDNILVTGATNSPNFPTTPGAYDEDYNGGLLSPEDVFVFKLSADGSSLLYGTFVGGQGIDYGKSVIVDGSGNAIVTGYAWSSNFPTTGGAYDESHNGNADAFVFKLSASGNELLFSTVVGANGLDYGEALELDGTGSILLTGYAWSSNFPTTPGAYDESHNGNADAIVLKLSADGSDLLYSTFVGGGGLDHGYNLAVDGYGDVIVSGYAWSSDFPTTAGAYDEIHNGNADSFVLKLAADGSDLIYNTFVGSEGLDYAYSLAIDAYGNAIVAGHTDSAGFPTSDGAFDRSFNGGNLDVFVYKLSADGSALQYSTFLGGSGADYAYSVIADDMGQAVGTGYSDSSNFPTTSGAYDEGFNGGEDVVLFKLSVDGRSLPYSSFLGGSGDDEGLFVTLDESGNGLVAGATASANFPATTGAYDEIHNGNSDVFVLRVDELTYGGPSFQISGTVEDGDGHPVPYVTISTNAGFGATTDDAGVYAMTGVVTGTYVITPTRCGYTFSPATRMASVPPDAVGQDFTATKMRIPTSQPIVLVHGIQLNPKREARRCSDGIGCLGDDGVNNPFGDMAEWLAEAGYDVWIANVDTGPSYTPTIEENAQCLREQIQQVLDDGETQGDQVILVAHSMGGLVSRACLNLNDCRDNVAALYTLGSPHAGINSLFLLKLLGYYKAPTLTDLVCAWQPAVCQFSTDGMLWFNLRHPNQSEMDYSFIGGTRMPFPWGWLLSLFEGRNDGAIGSYSAVGWLYPTQLNVVLGPEADRYWTGEAHGKGSGHPSYFEESCGVESQSFCCIAWADCTEAGSQALEAAQADLALTAATRDVGGHLHSGQSVSHTLQIDTSDRSLFLLSWITGTLSFTLTQPNGQVVTPAYADTHTDVVTYTAGSGDGETPPFAAYAFTATLPGLYTVTVGAEDVGSDGTGYLVSAALETGRTFSVMVDADLYQPGDTAVFTATLMGPSGGINGAIVSAELTQMDGLTDTLTLTDLGGGTYRTTYIVPDVPGYLQVTFTAIGDDSGTAFTRQADKLLTIAPHDAQLASTYADWPEDTDGDGFDDTLALDVGLMATYVGTYTLSADLSVGGQTIAHAARYVILYAGTQTVTLRFDGWDIRGSRVDGPYTVTHVHLVDLGVGGVPAQIADDVWVTKAYRWQDFGFEVAYLPLILRNY